MKKFVNYYRVLDVGRKSVSADIRNSFRRLAKKYHPDTTALEPGLAAAHMRLLLVAYRVLMDGAKRSAYDLRFKLVLEEGGNPRLEKLRNRGEDPYSRALLTLRSLLNGQHREAISLCQTLFPLFQDGRDTLQKLLGTGDYLDFLFLLAEAFEAAGDFPRAAGLYEKAYREDLKWEYFRHFRSELKHRIRTVYCRHLARDPDPQVAVSRYRVLLEEYSFPRQDRAFFLKKMAERFCELGNFARAREHLEQAERLKPGLAGTKKLRLRLDENKHRA